MNFTLKTLALATFVATLFSCSQKEILEGENMVRGESILTININGGTVSKASGPGHGNQTEDNFVQTLEIFVFHADGPNAGELDAYQKFTASGNLSNLQVKATTGKKTIYAVANSHRVDWKGIVLLDQFKEVQTELVGEDVKNYLMTGSAEATLQVATSVTISISRMVAKVVLQGIKTAFAGTPYEGMTLTNVKAYLINVHGTKHISNGEGAAPLILNHKKLVATDVSHCTMAGMLYDAVNPAIDDSGYTNVHYFYAYENTLEIESAANRFTRLVIEADLNGKTYYYPVNINQPDYGYDPVNGHKGVKRNTAYRINVTILRPGSTDPDQPVEHGTLGVTLNILDWVTTPVANPEF